MHTFKMHSVKYYLICQNKIFLFYFMSQANTHTHFSSIWLSVLPTKNSKAKTWAVIGQQPLLLLHTSFFLQYTSSYIITVRATSVCSSSGFLLLSLTCTNVPFQSGGESDITPLSFFSYSAGSRFFLTFLSF